MSPEATKSIITAILVATDRICATIADAAGKDDTGYDGWTERGIAKHAKAAQEIVNHNTHL